jgi:hypothetical protein
MRRLVWAFFFWGLWAPVWALNPADWEGEAALETSRTAGGVHCLIVEPWVFDACRPNLDDLRIVDETGNETPYVLFWGQDTAGRFQESVLDTQRQIWLASCPVVSAEVRENAESRETVLDLDLGFRHLPLETLAIPVADAHFYRDFVLEGRDTERQEVRRRTETGAKVREIESPWQPVTRGVLFRVIEPQGVREQLTVKKIPVSHRFLRFRIENQDNPPLRIGDGELQVLRREVRLVFEVAAGKTYRLLYGNERVGRPLYDLKVSVAELGTDRMPRARLGERVPKAKPEKVVPWSERYAVPIWIGTIACMVAVLWLLVTQLRSVKSSPPGGDATP